MYASLQFSGAAFELPTNSVRRSHEPFISFSMESPRLDQPRQWNNITHQLKEQAIQAIQLFPPSTFPQLIRHVRTRALRRRRRTHLKDGLRLVHMARNPYAQCWK